MEDRSKELNCFFTENFELYKKVNAYSILLEKISGGKVEVASINELRGVLYHLFRFFETDSREDFKVTTDYIEGKEHLYRAYFDLFSSICNILLEKIHEYSQDYTPLVISQIYPKYYQEILPEVTILKEQISHVRLIRQNVAKPEDSFVTNHEIIAVLLGFYKGLQSVTDALALRKEEIRKASKKDLYQKIILCVAGAALALILREAYASFVTPPSQSPATVIPAATK